MHRGELHERIGARLGRPSWSYASKIQAGHLHLFCTEYIAPQTWRLPGTSICVFEESRGRPFSVMNRNINRHRGVDTAWNSIQRRRMGSCVVAASRFSKGCSTQSFEFLFTEVQQRLIKNHFTVNAVWAFRSLPRRLKAPGSKSPDREQE